MLPERTFLLDTPSQPMKGQGRKRVCPDRERPTIENLAREAVAANAIKTFRFQGPHDAILFVAVPIHEPLRWNSGHWRLG